MTTTETIATRKEQSIQFNGNSPATVERLAKEKRLHYNNIPRLEE